MIDELDKTARVALASIIALAVVLGFLGTVGYAQMFRGAPAQNGGNMMNGSGMMGGNDMGGMGGMGGMMDSMMSNCHGSGTGTSGSGTMVAISGYSFNPQTLRVSVGTTVTWTNMDTVAHSVVSGTPNQPSGLFQSSLLGNGQSFSYTFDTPGTYTYYCGPHPYMTGTIVVE